MLENSVRREQTLRQLARVADAVREWFAPRTAIAAPGGDRFAQLHKTRLETLQAVLTEGLQVLEKAACNVKTEPTRDQREVYAECRQIEQAVQWLERVFLFYADKFNQRSDPTCAPLLEAADELIWSCYAPIFATSNHLPKSISQGPAPLAYLDTAYSPATWESNRLAPSELRQSTEIEALQTFLSMLPVPVLRLPTWCLGNPWWLVFVAHEVGHNVLRDLGLASQFADLLAPPETQDPIEKAWRRWSDEIFADLFSVAMLGGAALQALVETELDSVQRMTKPAGVYPPAAVRLELLACAADELGFDGRTAIKRLDLDTAIAGNAQTHATAGMLQTMVKRALGPLGNGIGTLADLARVEKRKTQLQTSVAYWAKHLANKPPQPHRGIETPCYVAAGAWIAWCRASEISSKADRQTAIEHLASNTIVVMRSAGEEGPRAGTKPTPAQEAGANLAHRLLDLGRQDAAP